MAMAVPGVHACNKIRLLGHVIGYSGIVCEGALGDGVVFGKLHSGGLARDAIRGERAE